MVRHYNIPIFFPELACPFRCIYCNQAAISGQHQLPADEDIIRIINEYLASMTAVPRHVEVAFFGGNFTGLPLPVQQHYLELVSAFVHEGKVQGIRLSTRPDYINKAVMQLLSRFPVHAIELGAQSLNDDVLEQSGRGHSRSVVQQASETIRNHGIRLGLQMMTGLPGDTPEKAIETARSIIAFGASETRIYPCLVIKDTPLELLYQRGAYQPQPLNAAVALSAQLYELFRSAGVKVLRMGLHPSADLNSGSLVAGPYHPSFNELVMTHIWKQHFEAHPFLASEKGLMLTVPPHQLNHAVGFEAVNKKWLLQRYSEVRFRADATLLPFSFRTNYF